MHNNNSVLSKLVNINNSLVACLSRIEEEIRAQLKSGGCKWIFSRIIIEKKKKAGLKERNKKAKGLMA